MADKKAIEEMQETLTGKRGPVPRRRRMAKIARSERRRLGKPVVDRSGRAQRRLARGRP